MKKMSVYNIFNSMYKYAITDEKLMRLLFYVAKHKDDDVTVENEERPNIIGGLNDQIYNNGLNEENLTSFDIINQVVKMRRPNANDLSKDNPQCCVFIYLDTFENYTVKSSSGTSIDPLGFSQNVNFDIYAHEDFVNTDYRLAKLIDRIIYLFNQKHVGGLGGCTFMGATKLDDVESYEGMQVKFANKYSTR